LLPQGQPEKNKRVRAMINKMEEEGFGGCSNYYECEAACPKNISVRFIAKMNRDYFGAVVKEGTKV
jgi:succinate dehydrogenase / fumarate reductase iron-sulfur subunit